MKGLVLSGGSGTRLYPMTRAVSKQLLPIYDKPMIYYPLSLLMMAGIREILIITRPGDRADYAALLGDGGHLGLTIEFAVQSEPRGIADAFVIGSDFIDGEPCALALGDNVLDGNGLERLLPRLAAETTGATLLSRSVPDPERFGIATFDADQRITAIEEKPRSPVSDQAIIGLYFYDHRVVDVARGLTPSTRGELEITDINRWYLARNAVQVQRLGTEFSWFDAGTSESLFECAAHVRDRECRDGLKIGCVEEIAYRQGLIGIDELWGAARRHAGTGYGQYLNDLADGLRHTSAERTKILVG